MSKTTGPAAGIALRPTTAYVDLDALEANVAAIRTRVGRDVRIMGVVKANAYGHGLVPVARALLTFGVDALGVAFLEEGIALRRAGVRAPILVLGGLIGNQIVHFLEFDLQITASSTFKLKQIEAQAAASGRRAQVHLKIDTGMERIGMHWDTAGQLLAAARRVRHCDIQGVFSHFASSDDEDPAYTRLQLSRFQECLDRVPGSWPRHIGNSGAILQHPDAHLDMVRPGIIMYGVYPTATVEKTVPLRPVLSLHTRVVYFKVVRSGCSVSYNRTWTAPEDTRVVTLPVGYGDGYARGLSDRSEVLIHGRRHRSVGRITMDAMMVNIGQTSAYNGDPVVLLGRQGDDEIRVEELAEHLGTIPYEVLTALSVRVPRVYVGRAAQRLNLTSIP